jgi:cysteine synthase A
MRYENILEDIGNTPHVRIKRLFPGAEHVWLKLERNNPGGSIKDRIALAMVRDAEEKGILQAGATIIEPTSGNTGIGLAMVAAVKGYRLILVMPDSMSVERRSILRAYGAELVLTPGASGMKGSMARARELSAGIKGSWIPSQFDNPANPSTHEETTAREIASDFPGGIDYLVTGVGTGGHISGVSRALKQQMPGLNVLAVEPAASPVISGGDPSPHGIMGIGAGFIPGNLDRDVLDGVIQVEQEAAFSYAVRLAKKEGILGGISTGASLAAVAQLLENVDPGSQILTFNYDSGERYLSVNGLF